jgi:uncharacterized protein (AIM24 family)
MAGQTLQEVWAAATAGGPPPLAAFEVEKDKFLKVHLGGPAGAAGGPLGFVWMKKGAMVAHTGGGVSFEREGALEHGLKHALKTAATGAGAELVRASAAAAEPATLLLAERGKSVVLLRLVGDAVVVSAGDLLAFEPAAIRHEIAAVRSVSAAVSFGLFHVRLQGHGFVAMLAHGRPLVLPVLPGWPPVYTDPQATVAWSANLDPGLELAVGFRTLLGRGSGESLQAKFEAGAATGPGFVVVQPYEEKPPPPPADDGDTSLSSASWIVEAGLGLLGGGA